MNREKRILYIEKLCSNLNNTNVQTIENSLVTYIKNKLEKTNKKTPEENIDKNFYEKLIKMNFPIDIEYIIEFFEYLVDKDNKTENGIVFTPKYISDFIVEDILGEIKEWNKNIKIIDPSCGCGIFLISAINYLHKKYNVDIIKIIENNIYGIDILEDVNMY